jgi:hypothetical protein
MNAKDALRLNDVIQDPLKRNKKKAGRRENPGAPARMIPPKRCEG